MVTDVFKSRCKVSKFCQHLSSLSLQIDEKTEKRV